MLIDTMGEGLKIGVFGYRIKGCSMPHAQKVVKVSGFMLLAMLAIGMVSFSSLSSFWAQKNNAHATASSLPYHEFADGPYKVQGNTILGADGKPYLFHGVGRDGFEFVCTGPTFIDPTHLAFMGPGSSGSGGTYWWSNTVRIPLSEGFWLKGSPSQNCTASQYQGIIKQTVDAITALKLNVILDLQWTDAGGQAPEGGAGFELPDNDSLTFWSQAANIYKGYSNVLFELYNEPHPPTWPCWAAGCTIQNDNTPGQPAYTYPGVGMQALVNTVRGAGANNLVLVAGLNWGFDLSQLSSFPITGSNIVYDAHPYPYPGKGPGNWDAAFGYLTAKAPVMSAENGEYDCQSTYMSQLMNYFDAHQMGWIAWAWYNVGSSNPSAGCGYPELLLDFNGTPSPNMGTFIHQRLLSYVSIAPPPPPAVGPVSKVWYLAEGRVGGGFHEWLTLGNPTASLCSVSIQYLYQPDRGTSQVKTLSFNLDAYQRATRDVDADLGTSTFGHGITDSAIVTASGCAGIVAERPMYFNALGVNSGDDTLGTTHLGTTFYFGDMAVGGQPGGGSYSSFIAILNPPGGSMATVSATYYANGQQVGSQQVSVPGGTRGTIFPANANPHLPSHVVVALNSTQPVMIERPTYFSGINAGNAGIVSGAGDVAGVQTQSNDWLFAEGYTGGQFQENFAIANVNATAANVTIKLEYTNGTTRPFNIMVNPKSQVIWNVNAANAGAPSQDVSAEITSTGAPIIAEREMFFKYNHAANGRTLSAIGGTDVLGMVAPVASAYSFAEGYTNVGYDEWLTIQNPTGSAETITITLSNATGNSYTWQVTIGAHSRYTQDIVATVLQHLYHSGDGYKGFEVSMALQSNSGLFLAERPMYWNASGTQGGSDAIGYTGG
jgi:endoglucanase